MEKRSAPPSYRTKMESRLRGYNSDIRKFRSDLVRPARGYRLLLRAGRARTHCPQRLHTGAGLRLPAAAPAKPTRWPHARALVQTSAQRSGGASQYATDRTELLSGGGDWESHTYDQRSRLVDSEATLNRTSQRIQNSQRIGEESEAIGAGVLTELGTQRETIIRTAHRVQSVDANLGKSKRLLNAMSRRVMTNQMTMVTVSTARRARRSSGYRSHLTNAAACVWPPTQIILVLMAILGLALYLKLH